MLLSHAGGGHGRKALAALDFYAHADLFMTPSAEFADVVLPIASAFEREALRIGFEISEDAQSLIQLRHAVAPPLGEARADTDFVFALAFRLDLGAIDEGDWVSIVTLEGSVRARARFNADLDPRVAVGEHGWWQACAEIGASGYNPFGPDGANFNLLIGRDVLDPVSGTPSLRAYLFEIRRTA
jgi:anaerobic selenocysteine-containing dehydrogenase